MTPALTVTAVVGLLALAMVLALCEVVLVHVSVPRATAMSDTSDERTRRRAAELVRILHRREATLGAVLFTRLVAQVGAIGAIVELGRGQGLGTGPWLAIAAAIVVLLGTIEAFAKTFGLVRTDRVAVQVTPIVALIGRIPLLGLVGSMLSSFIRRNTPGTDEVERPNVSEEELLALAEVAVEADVIETSEQALIESIIAFGDTIVREVMVPRPDMVTVDAAWKVSDVMEVVILNGFSRIPVVGDGHRRRRRHRLRQGPDARRARRQRRRTRSASTSARPASSPSSNGCRRCCPRCSPSSSTWRSWSTSTAASPAS